MIVITSMESLPDHCYECPCHDGESGYCQADKEHRYSDYRPCWCPLKEQESVKPTLKRKWKNKLYNDYKCPACGNDIYHGQKYCSECGQEMNWDE